MTKKAIIHVENTDNLIEFAQYLVSSGWTILSANKTYDFLEKENIPVVKEPALVENNQYTLETCKLVQDILDTKLSDEDSFEEVESPDIFLVCMNVNPVYEKINSEQELIKKPNLPNYYHTTLIKNAVSNYDNVLVVTDPADYKEVLIQLRVGNIKAEFRAYLAAKALNLLSAYENAIAFSVLNGKVFNQPFMNYFGAPYKKTMDLKYGANKQQKASLYGFLDGNSDELQVSKIQGKEFSYSIIDDVSFAWEQVSFLFTKLKNQMVVKTKNCDGYEFTTHFTPLLGTVFTVAVKNRIILGAALSSNVLDSFTRANFYDENVTSGVVIACSSVVDEVAAREMVKNNFEAIVAPGFTTEAKQIFSANRNIRLVPSTQVRVENIEVKLILGGLLVQTKEDTLFEKWEIKTKNRPSQYKIDEMAFGMMLVMNSKSHSVALIKENTVVSLVQSCSSVYKAIRNVLVEAKESVERKSKQEGFVNDGTFADILVSDSAIPFCDETKNLLENGVTAIIQPGGTENDAEFIQYCDERGIVMIFTGMPHIKS